MQKIYNFFLVDLFNLLECLHHGQHLTVELQIFVGSVTSDDNAFELKVIKFPVVLKYKTITRNDKLERSFVCCK